MIIFRPVGHEKTNPIFTALDDGMGAWDENQAERVRLARQIRAFRFKPSRPMRSIGDSANFASKDSPSKLKTSCKSIRALLR